MNRKNIEGDRYCGRPSDQLGERHVKYRRHHECSVAFMVARADRTIKRKNKLVTVETLYGFRYAIYLLAIGLGAHPAIDLPPPSRQAQPTTGLTV